MYHFQLAGTPTAKRLQRDIYVDNLITGVKNLQEAESLYTESKTLFSSASMNLREWGSNSREFISFIGEKDQASTVTVKVLGIIWDCEKDSLVIPGPTRSNLEEASTKHQVLQVIGYVFDQLGYYSPTVLRTKLFMKMLWKEGCKWDTKLDSKKLTTWLEIQEDLKDIPKYSIQRYLGFPETEHFTDLTLICFCDTSVKAYATAIYLHHSSLGTYKSDLIFSKTCLAPEQITILRLELLGVLIGICTLKFVEKELHLPVALKFLWTDSQCVLHWMQTAKPLPVFITN